MTGIPKPDTAASSWARIDLGPYLRGEIETPTPTMLDRSDQVCLLYPGKLHWFSGEPESCKSWLAAIAVADALADGLAAVYVDYERDPAAIVERLLALGVPTEAIEDRLSYHQPRDPTSTEAIQHVLNSVEALHPVIAVIDGVNAAMGMDGRNTNLSSDFYLWWNGLGSKLLAAIPGPTIAIDHVIKDREARGPYATGTGQKLAAVDVHIGLETQTPFAPGTRGQIRLLLHKDTFGRLRMIASGSKRTGLGTLHLDSAETGAVRFAITPTEPAEVFRPTALMERVSRYLEVSPEPRAKRHLRENVQGKDSVIETAVDRLNVEGYLDRSTRSGRDVFASSRPYREAEDPASSEGSESDGAQWCLRGAGHRAERNGAHGARPYYKRPAPGTVPSGGPYPDGAQANGHHQTGTTKQSRARSSCPFCGNRSWAPVDDGHRRCDGPAGCGQVYA